MTLSMNACRLSTSLIGLALLAASASAQEDLTTWETETYGSPMRPPNWTLLANQATQSEDSDVASIARGGQTLGDKVTTVEMTPFHLTGISEDQVGLVFGAGAGMASDANADYIAMLWGGATGLLADDPTCTTGGSCFTGLRLFSVKGIPTQDEFWQGQDQDTVCSPLGVGLTEIAQSTNLGNTAWGQNQTYSVEIRLSDCALRIAIDGTPEFEVLGDMSNIVDGELGLYSMSQRLLVTDVNYSPLPNPASITVAGPGTMGSDRIPSLTFDGCATNGGSFDFTILNSSDTNISTGLLFLSPQPTNFFLGLVGGNIYLNPAASASLTTNAPAGGTFQLGFNLTPDPALIGMDFGAQAFWLDTAATANVALTNGLLVVIGE